MFSVEHKFGSTLNASFPVGHSHPIRPQHAVFRATHRDDWSDRPAGGLTNRIRIRQSAAAEVQTGSGFVRYTRPTNHLPDSISCATGSANASRRDAMFIA